MPAVGFRRTPRAARVQPDAGGQEVRDLAHNTLQGHEARPSSLQRPRDLRAVGTREVFDRHAGEEPNGTAATFARRPEAEKEDNFMTDQTKSTEKWSPTAWCIEDHGMDGLIIFGANGYIVASFLHSEINQATRIVECVNACANLQEPDEDIRGMGNQIKKYEEHFKKLREDNAQLTAENQALREKDEQQRAQVLDGITLRDLDIRDLKQERDQLQSSLKEMTRLRDEAVKNLKLEQEANWTGSLIDRLNELVRENRPLFAEVSSGGEASELIQEIHGLFNGLRADAKQHGKQSLESFHQVESLRAQLANAQEAVEWCRDLKKRGQTGQIIVLSIEQHRSLVEIIGK
jgi:hypothetical protein